ncbi:DUF4352 domain-containing protein [Corynebacterium sp. HMSC068G04]|uniref:DUF4352 domain-containing protein n=1 Tax=Corynebacterium sp. HMSC068G04 TaxID=1739497 RepID=UPI00114CE6D3|nr:DUF4352 domain-containing protein [Corynebacterium sp. HMSC068G04]
MFPNDAQQPPQPTLGQNPFSTAPQSAGSSSSAKSASPKAAWWMVPVAAVVGVALGAGATYAFTGSKEEQVSAASVEPAAIPSGEEKVVNDPHSENNNATSPSMDDIPVLGEPAMSGTEQVTIDSVTLAPNVEMKNEDFSTGAPDSVLGNPKNEGAQFVIVSGTVSNKGTAPFTARFDNFGLIADLRGRTYEPIEDHWKVYANWDILNDSVGPGFSTPYTWVFEVPDDFTPALFGYDDRGDNIIGNNIAFIDVRR